MQSLPDVKSSNIHYQGREQQLDRDKNGIAVVYPEFAFACHRSTWTSVFSSISSHTVPRVSPWWNARSVI